MTDFIIIGNMNAITYKEIFPLIKENKIWAGCKGFSGGMDFNVDEQNYGTSKEKQKSKIIGGKIVKNISGCIWFTNLEHNKRKEFVGLTKTYDPEDYPKYDNYDAINVDRIKDIPSDYYGTIGVPITYLDKHNPNQFEILDARDYTDNKRLKKKSTYLIKDADGSINGKNTYARILIRRKEQ